MHWLDGNVVATVLQSKNLPFHPYSDYMNTNWLDFKFDLK